jgi:hypothetical protein
MPSTTAFDAALLVAYPGPGVRARGLQAGANYKLRQYYLAGITDPTAHTLAKNNPRQLKALTDAGNLATFDAITTAYTPDAPAAANVRVFDGVDDEIRVATGAANPTGELAIWMVARRTATGVWGAPFAGHNSGGAYQWTFGFDQLDRAAFFVVAGGGIAVTSFGTGTFGNSATWYLMAYTKAAGVNAGRFHYKALAAGAWTHVAGVTSGDSLPTITPGNPATIAGGTIRFGEAQDTDDFNGRLAHAGLAGGAGANLSDAAVESTFSGLSTAAAVAFANGFAIKGAWDFTQADTATDVTDLTGGGANETIVNGTTAATGDMPPGWTFA